MSVACSMTCQHGQTQTHRYTQTHTDTHTHTQMDRHTHTHTQTHTDTHTHTHTHTHKCGYEMEHTWGEASSKHRSNKNRPHHNDEKHTP